MERDIEKDLLEIECAIKEHEERDNTFTVSVLQRCHELVSELKKDRDLEEQGLLIRLPCKVEDTVYSLNRFCGGYSSDCPSRPCKQCPDYQLEIYEGKFQLKDIYDFGKTVFLTQAEAEEVLKRMEDSDAGSI